MRVDFCSATAGRLPALRVHGHVVPHKLHDQRVRQLALCLQRLRGRVRRHGLERVVHGAAGGSHRRVLPRLPEPAPRMGERLPHQRQLRDWSRRSTAPDGELRHARQRLHSRGYGDGPRPRAAEGPRLRRLHPHAARGVRAARHAGVPVRLPPAAATAGELTRGAYESADRGHLDAWNRRWRHHHARVEVGDE